MASANGLSAFPLSGFTSPPGDNIPDVAEQIMGVVAAQCSPAGGSPAVVVGAALTAPAGNGKYLLNTAAGSTLTLPPATGSGAVIEAVVTTTATSNAHKILANSVSDFIQGFATGENAGTAKCFASTGGTQHSIQMPFAGTQPSGGFIGDDFRFIDITVNLWQCVGVYQAGVTPTTPFSTATT